jgi:hypothetical protein
MLKKLSRTSRVALAVVIIVAAVLEFVARVLILVGFGDPYYEEAAANLVLDWALYSVAITVIVIWVLALMGRLVEPEKTVSFTSVGPQEGTTREVVKVSRASRRVWPLAPPQSAARNLFRLSLLTATLLTFAVFVAVEFYPLEQYRGLWVYLVGSRVTVNSPSVVSAGVVIQLRPGQKGRSVEILIDSSPTARESLESVLLDKFKTRANRFVYIDGDPSLAFRDVAEVIDTAEGLNAKVVLLSPPPIHANHR